MKKIQTIQTKDYIISAIRKEILAKNLKPGEELTQEGIAEALGVSRMPVREALQALCQEGFLQRMPNRHIQVVAIEPDEIRTTFQIIAAMEGEMLMILKKRGASPEDCMERLRRWKEAQASQNVEAMAEAELAFHETLALSLKNPYVAQNFLSLLSGYITYVIESISHEPWDHAKRVAHLEKAVTTTSKSETEKNLRAYYGELTQVLV